MPYNGTEPNNATIIERLAVILEADLTLFPVDPTLRLLNQVYRFLPPIPENPDSGIGPPLAFVTTPDKANVFTEQLGRDNRNAKGIQRKELEFYIVLITFDSTYGRTKAEQNIYSLVSAVKSALFKNLRLVDPATGLDASRLCSTLDIYDVPFNLNTEEKSMVARNVVIRPKLETNFA